MSMPVLVLASMAAALQSATDDGLTFSNFLDSIPTDPASIFTGLLMLASVGLVLWFGRSKGGKGGKPA